MFWYRHVSLLIMWQGSKGKMKLTDFITGSISQNCKWANYRNPPIIPSFSQACALYPPSDCKMGRVNRLLHDMLKDHKAFCTGELYGFLFKDFFIYLKGRERIRDRGFLSAGLLPNWLQQPGLDQMEARRQKLLSGLPWRWQGSQFLGYVALLLQMH